MQIKFASLLISGAQYPRQGRTATLGAELLAHVFADAEAGTAAGKKTLS